MAQIGRSSKLVLPQWSLWCRNHLFVAWIEGTWPWLIWRRCLLRMLTPAVSKWIVFSTSNALSDEIWTLLCFSFDCVLSRILRFVFLSLWCSVFARMCVLSQTLLVLSKSSHRIFVISNAWGCTRITLPYQRLYDLFHEMQLQIFIRKRSRSFLWRKMGEISKVINKERERELGLIWNAVMGLGSVSVVGRLKMSPTSFNNFKDLSKMWGAQWTCS